LLRDTLKPVADHRQVPRAQTPRQASRVSRRIDIIFLISVDQRRKKIAALISAVYRKSIFNVAFWICFPLSEHYFDSARERQSRDKGRMMRNVVKLNLIARHEATNQGLPLLFYPWRSSL